MPPALLVSLHRPFRRLQISGVEARLRKLGEDAGVKNVHPHKFRRTLATKAIDKGMPIEQVQVLLVSLVLVLLWALPSVSLVRLP